MRKLTSLTQSEAQQSLCLCYIVVPVIIPLSLQRTIAVQYVVKKQHGLILSDFISVFGSSFPCFNFLRG